MKVSDPAIVQPPLADPTQLAKLARDLKDWAMAAGFAQCGITDTHLEHHGRHLREWLARGFHGEMRYMADHGDKRYKPTALVPGTVRIIALRMNYWPEAIAQTEQALARPATAFVSRYTLGRDYHKVMRRRLSALAKQLAAAVSGSHYRVFTDSAPVLERALASKAGLGWIGKNTMLIHPKAGSLFFLGEIFTDIPLALDPPFAGEHCGTCRQCLDLCPTHAFAGPHQLDARRCISYLTIELKGAIPEELRPLMGNRIFGCDDCQLVCPWNKFATLSTEPDFSPRHKLDQQQLTELFAWTEDEFLSKTAGAAIRRTGYEGWLRNIAVALGNGPASKESMASLTLRANDRSAIVREHVQWAINRLQQKLNSASN